MNDPIIPTRYANDEAFQTAWAQMTPVLRKELERASEELENGIAIYRDRIVDRPKHDGNGFYGLAVAERVLLRSEHRGAPIDILTQQRRNVATLREALEADEAAVAEIVDMAEEMKPYEEYAAAQGTTLPILLDRWTTIEQTLRRDFFEGYCLVCDQMGFDPIVVMQRSLSEGKHAH